MKIFKLIKKSLNSDFIFEKTEKNNSNEIPLDGTNISFNKNDKLNNSIEHHKINNDYKQENDIKKSEDNKEDLNNINKNIIIQNNEKIESNAINKISSQEKLIIIV